MQIKVTRNQGFTIIEKIGLVAVVIILLGTLVPKPDFQKVNVEARKVHAEHVRFESTNVVRALWKHYDDGIYEIDFDHVPPELSNTLVRVNGHVFRLTYVPELDSTNYTRATNH